MPTLKLRPTPGFDLSRDSFFFEAKELNYWQRNMFQDDFGFYQRNFSTFKYMQLDKQNKYTIHRPRANWMMWQPLNACNYDPAGMVRIGKTSLEPTPAYVHQKWCWDELFDSCYEQMLQYFQDGALELSPEGERVFRDLVQEILTAAAYGSRIANITGQLYEGESVEFQTQVGDNAVTVEIKDLFNKVQNVTKGVLKLMQDTATSEGREHLDLNGLLAGSDFTDQQYTGDVLALFDSVKAQAPKPLRQLINRGGVVRAGGEVFIPQVIVSDSMHAAIAQQYISEGEKVAQNMMRLTKRTFGAENSPTPQAVYYIDGTIPVIPLSEINEPDRYLTGTTHFFGIVGSNVLQLGNSFGAIENIEDGIGMLIEKIVTNENGNLGSYVFTTHGLFANAIADADYVAATKAYVT